ncbi:hypothetical protein V2O64_19385 [Verrucomicrobiaceae bacterium 227]
MASMQDLDRGVLLTAYDPAEFQGDEEIVKKEFRRVRDEIKLVMTAYVAGLLEEKI